MKIILILLLLISPSFAKPLVADISSHEITIHTAFSGTELMIFGARNDPGDIIAIIRGPSKDAIIRKKEKIFGMWINKKEEIFTDIPSFYSLAASRPYEEIKKSYLFPPLGVGYKNSVLKNEKTSLDRQEFLRAFLRHMRKLELYNNSPAKISFIGETLFKIVVPFPDNTPRGTYSAEIYLFSDGELSGSYSMPINVTKKGFDAFIYEAAKNHSTIYGFTAIFIALFAGWLAGKIFQRK